MWWKVDFIWQPTSSVVGLRRNFKALPKAKLAPKESRSLFGGQLLVRSTIAFWILEKPLHLRSMLSKLMRCTENCNACSQHWSTERTQFFLRQRPTTRHTTKASKVEWIGLWSFASLPYSPDLSPINYHFKHFDNFFARKTLPQSAGGRKCFPRVPRILRHGFLFYRNKQTYLLWAKMCWL